MSDFENNLFRKLDEFEIVEELAAENNIRYLKARDTARGNTFLLKRFMNVVSHATRNIRADGEMSMLKGLREFPGIVRSCGHFLDKNDLYIVLEYEDGWQSLRHVADDNASTRPDRLPVLSSSDLCVLTVEMIRILEFLHSHEPPIIHRDIRPENIFNIFTFDMSKYKGYKFKLGDFGSAVYEADFSQSFSSGLTRSYMAPEVAAFLDGQIVGEHDVESISVKTDMWNFGATLLDLAVDTDVFDLSKASGGAIRAKIRNHSFQLKEDVLASLSVERRKRWENINPFVQEVIIQCLRVRVADRPSAAAIRNSAPYKVAKHLSRSFYEEMFLLKLRLSPKALSTSVSTSSVSGSDETRGCSSNGQTVLFYQESNISMISNGTSKEILVSNAYIDNLFAMSICGKAEAFLELQNLAVAQTKDSYQLAHPLATALLMCIYATGGNSIPKDMAKAEALSGSVLEWLRGDSSDDPDLTKYKYFVWSICFHRGLGVLRDSSNVEKYLQLSSDLGYIPATNNLGILLYSNPQATINHLMDAFALFTKCALAEYPPGHYSMGLVYEEKRIFPSFSAHQSMAFQYYSIAARHGYLPAITKVDSGQFIGYRSSK